MKLNTVFTRIALYLIIIISVLSCAHKKIAEPESDHKTAPKLDHTYNPATSIIKFYQGPLNHLSAVRSGECPMHPTCSEYSRESFQKYGFVVGWVMTMDRLMRCGRDEIKLSPRIYVHGQWQYYDPVEN